MKTTLMEVFLLEDEEFWQSLGRWGENPGAEEMADLLKRKPPPRPTEAPKISKEQAEYLVGTLNQISNQSNQARSEIIKWSKGETDYPEETTASIVYEFVRALIKDIEKLKEFQ